MITLWKADGLPKNDPLSKFALPEGFPFLVVESAESIEIQERVLLYLHEKFVRGKGRRGWKKNTAEAYAYDLRDWFAFLEVCEDESDENGKVGKAWDAATEEDYINYRDALQDAVSPHTRQYLSHSTIRRRQSSVENFYKEAQRRDWYVDALLKTSEFKKGRIRPAERDAKAFRNCKKGCSSTTASSIASTSIFIYVSLRAVSKIYRSLGSQRLGQGPLFAREQALLEAQGVYADLDTAGA